MKTRESSSPKVRKPRATKKHPSHEEIALRAYHIYMERHGAPGNPLEDWTRAKRELMEQPKKTRRKATVTPIAA